ncbi:type VI secretion system protein TssL, long form [Roseibium sp. RKSG952]|uniref:type VI secretion system protein TssL, long form n=1 Tax=Roseibium sp. RKSG952 TaxID=2529384 RepID=UPI0012BD3276|nr:type VI secretion system protein TssL, long form [Roseibium sp. RKSG952]MTH98021.1 type VI secretion system protein TssL [Roseibium sp. RKSG952]
MNRDDPFAEPFDTEKTVIRPNPGGRRSAMPPAMPPPPGAQSGHAPGGPVPPQHPGPAAASGNPGPGAPAPAAAPPAHIRQGGAVPLSSANTGMNPLNAAASPLFSLVARIRNRAQHADPAALRESVVAEIRAFGTAAQHAAIPVQTVRIARYAICATIDDVVLNTPWGGNSIWTQQSMVGTFHKETYGGDRLYDILSRLEKSPAENRDLLEFLYVCLSLGFEGRLRVADRGSEKHFSIREGLVRLIRTYRGPADPSLSPHWKGTDIGQQVRSIWTPVWIYGGAALAGMSLVFFTLSVLLSADTRQLSTKIAALDFQGPITLDRPAPPPPPPPPAPEEVKTIEAVSSFLEPEIRAGLVSVATEGNTLTVQIAGEAMFASASDQLAGAYEGIVDRVARALNDEAGRIIVAGHSDNVPINTARFPSNLQLSLARAKAVMARISSTLADPARISAEGRADKEPIASNDTPEGRARNRRIEVILVKAG